MLNIPAIIDKKIKEHVVEIEETLKAMSEQEEKMKKALAKNTKDLTATQKLYILKDKMLFHKACAAALNDIKEEITKESNNHDRGNKADNS